MKSFSKLQLLVGLALGLLVACVTLPETGESAFIMTSPAQEASMGAQAFAEVKKERKTSKDPAGQKRVRAVADRIIPYVAMPPMKWEIEVFEDETPNAFALPGGKIGVHTGMLKLVENDAQLAAVIGHELAHVTMRHGGQRMAMQIPLMLGTTAIGVALQNDNYRAQQLWMTAVGVGSEVFLVLPFSRDHEYQADEIGLRYMARAGYDPREAVKFWKKMEATSSGGKPPQFLSTHPSDENRIQRLEAAMPAAIRTYDAAPTR